ncbi:hypothetical protein IAI10_11225 [Clostridium sp. 19966]|uniref:hypothetical protein n=1 Tax=Clostridium sp. 19966 TaxID=2768166 RepID=UPI0028DF6225|nr:hypothetical protein [Clostridium sp. 19966]MDT8717229.1 hypothetical protein [Clostridium sp. 19966]
MNEKFEKLNYRLKNSFNEASKSLNNVLGNYKNKLENGLKYKIFTCPSCSQKLRVPRGRGNIVIRCKRCGIEFKGKC